MSECPKCSGEGRISYVEREPEDTRRELGDGYYTGPVTTYGSRLCECREALPEREGEASWWTTESIYAGEWESEVFRFTASIDVSAEVPISEDNYRVVRRGNRYWPTTIDLTFANEDGREAKIGWLWPKEARALAARLIEAADAADAIDKPDTCDECGVWLPMHTDACSLAGVAA